MLPRFRSCCLTALMLAPLTALAQDDRPAIERVVKLTIQSSKFPSLPGQSVTFSIFAEPVMGTLDPTGDISLFDDQTDLGTVTLKQSQASATRTFYSAGTH